jgi:two-component system heavy metal sensor histidine kinase CusS
LISRRWSVGRRITGWYVMTTMVLELAIAVTSAFYMRLSLDRELDALAREELEEMRVHFSVSGGRPDDVQTIAAQLATEHPATPFAWRIWDREGRVWGSFGRVELFERMPTALLDPAQSKAGAAHLRLSVDDLSPELRFGLLLDGSAQYGLLRRYGYSAFALLGLSALLAMAIGAVIGNRVSGVLRQVAASVRDLDSPLHTTALEVAGAPNEIREVTDAFQETLEKIRRQSERTRLLTAGLAHELRSPIQNLLGETEVTLLRPQGPRSGPGPRGPPGTSTCGRTPARPARRTG